VLVRVRSFARWFVCFLLTTGTVTTPNSNERQSPFALLVDSSTVAVLPNTNTITPIAASVTSVKHDRNPPATGVAKESLLSSSSSLAETESAKSGNPFSLATEAAVEAEQDKAMKRKQKHKLDLQPKAESKSAEAASSQKPSHQKKRARDEPNSNHASSFLDDAAKDNNGDDTDNDTDTNNDVNKELFDSSSSSKSSADDSGNDLLAKFLNAND